MSASLAANECRRQVRYDYTKDERIQKATTQCEALNRYAATESEKKRIAKDYDSRLDAIQAEIDQLNNAVLSGYELREYICYWTYDEPRPGRKTLRKREGGDVVAVEDMTERDRQMVMEIIDAQAAVGAAATQGGEKLDLPAFAMPTCVEDVTLSEDVAMSFDFDAGQCLAFAAAFFGVFAGEAGDDGNHALHSESERDLALATLLAKDNKWLIAFVGWLGEDTRANTPGAAWLVEALNAYLAGERIREEAEKAKAAAAKKGDKTRRRASGSGTVDVPSDEGCPRRRGQRLQGQTLSALP